METVKEPKSITINAEDGPIACTLEWLGQVKKALPDDALLKPYSGYKRDAIIEYINNNLLTPEIVVRYGWRENDKLSPEMHGWATLEEAKNYPNGDKYFLIKTIFHNGKFHSQEAI